LETPLTKKGAKHSGNKERVRNFVYRGALSLRIKLPEEMEISIGRRGIDGKKG